MAHRLYTGMVMLSLSLLGSLNIQVAERPLIQLTAQKAQALLIYLAVEARQTHQRDALMTLLWPDYAQRSARQSLRQHLYLLRQAIEPEITNAPLIVSGRDTVTLNPAAVLAVDAIQFEQLSGHGHSPQDWQQAADLYRGDFLLDFYLSDSEPFELWAANKRAFYQRRMQELVRRLVNYHLEGGDDEAAETAVRRQLKLDNLQESAHRQLMEIMARNGRRQEALAHFNTLTQLLQDELTIEPEADTVALVEAIRVGNVSYVEKDKPNLSHHKHSIHNLPYLLTSFIGREKELAEISELVTQHRLVTLTGVGGIGKTTLAIKVGQQLLTTFPNGVWFIELAPLADPKRVAQTAVYALGLRELSKRPSIETLLDYLRAKNCLLILDNCEHLIQATAQFTQTLLQSCPQMKILATSREIFDLPGETTYYVPPLSLPENQPLNLTQWSQYEALHLFVDRATTILPEFKVTQNNLQSLLQICQRLDGIPLALELAAARIKLLKPAQIVTRLEHRFNLLTRGNRTALPRQQTLKALVDWSWELLSLSEQILLRRLSVFAGGISLEAVEVVCNNDDTTDFDLLDFLTQLVNKSLVIVNRLQDQEARYHLLETIRQYAQERLIEAGEREKFQQRHLDYFCQLGSRAEKGLVGPVQADWLKRLELELDNLRVALKWAQAVDIEAGLQLAAALWKFWDSGYILEGETWLSQLIDRASNVSLSVKAKALGVQSDLNLQMFNLKRAQTLGNESLALYRRIEDGEGVAFALNRLAHLGIHNVIDAKIMYQMLEESLSIYRESGNLLGEAESLDLLGFYELDKKNDFEQAHKYYEESLSLHQQTRNLGGVSILLNHLGASAMFQRDFENSRSWLEQSLALQNLLGTPKYYTVRRFADLYFQLGNYELAKHYFEKSFELTQKTGEKGAGYWAKVWLGHIFLKTGDLNRAQKNLIECQQYFREVGDKIGVVFSLEGLANLAISQQQPKQALQLYAWADVTRQAIQNPRFPFSQEDVDEDIAAIQKMLNKEAYIAVHAAGQAMTMDEAVALALVKTKSQPNESPAQLRLTKNDGQS